MEAESKLDLSMDVSLRTLDTDIVLRSIRRALLVGLLADSLDICAVVYGFSRGEVESTTAGILGSAAAGAITLATFLLRAL